ncbi:tRNA (adenosine(37)-N6)-dimethylallyltransferase MiaA [Haliscomenobacter hydrossis]|uniref:tRNA (adenosine(37)-N6)-dimethylallyltransferase MiaA n=1 Tax=Haliscomenobacter hydrossis TaxID=2350 RepID=UPI0002F9D188|nr:tRNA (adenosine(37)-N6)-dimethylallyltransferase MiaA [Haliscomenobacter hydrossis]
MEAAVIFPEKKYLIVIGGPTASGKTALAIRLAQYFHTEILSADSRQFYQEMTIGTAKASAEELDMVPHHFINSLSIREAYNVGDFERDALALLAQLYQKHQVVILAGGSSLYIKALCEGLDVFPDVPTQIREEVEALYQSAGLAALQKELTQVDPVYFAEVDQSNPHRLIRAISVFRASGLPFSSFRTQQAEPRFFTPIYLWLEVPREILYERINQRVDQMLEHGLETEARSLFEQRHLNALQTVGYQELFDYFVGNISREEAIELIKRNSRRYAKRQGTWMRRDGFWHLFAPEQWEDILKFVQSIVSF